MSLLAQIHGPEDVRRLDAAQLADLAEEIRVFLVQAVSATGGHLGPNLGVVELTVALHRVFDSPQDTIVFDTGHISYVHKLLTGRQDFSGLRTKGGLSGYPSRAESDHDVVENSHASASLSWAAGIAHARRLRGENDRVTVAVIGDGALTGGMAWEALNNLASDKDLPLVVVVNDNTRSYAPTIGGLAEHLGWLRTTREYEKLLTWGKERLTRTPVVGKPALDTLHGMKKGLKDIVAPQGLFEDLGLKYVGPVDGHDEQAVEVALRQAKGFGAPVIVHVMTKKGHGYQPARNHVDDRFHAVGVINPETGLPLEVSGHSWTDEFSDAIEKLGEQREDLVALTAAMLIPVGLKGFAERFPDRVFDVGIAEQHAVTMAAGMAYGGLHPVVCVYSTFLNRAFDQMLMDCALHHAGVTFVLDRAGVTGNDGASHNGMWDMTLSNIVPGLRLAAPRDGQQVHRALAEAADVHDAPTVVRFPKGNPPAPMEALRSAGVVDVLAEPSAPSDGSDPAMVDDLIVGIGSMVPTALSVAKTVTATGRRVRVVDPRWCLPVPAELVDLARTAKRVVVIEDNLVGGGIGAAVALALSQAGVTAAVVQCGVPKRFLDHASRGQVLAEIGLTVPAITAQLTEQL
ncbi:1-deoxy-D-xylulose-5-phosphate synthase [Austwickia sp. TVS 96-490-7B]|uniref:1-deoxy-D-xylulose-5-phosphate synthase n=1 Tax=Austwickia sp. TVS 96-490-7B TaxID=2830843 RepID=UPI001C5A0224|nr:1-deoxy-D-xylulose-5-phosphate synthase [Austwickia sp. TVS 96-490-7B]MBW3086379.1 1-deoxy-D-xylulose-5-phosphate synthase [Austwickia sp. TVS 96-490-7B]